MHRSNCSRNTAVASSSRPEYAAGASAMTGIGKRRNFNATPTSGAATPVRPHNADFLAISAPSVARDAQCMLPSRSEEHTSELQSRENLVCRLLLEKKKEVEL